MRLSAAAALSLTGCNATPTMATHWSLAAHRMQQPGRHRVQGIGKSIQRIKTKIALAALKIADHRLVDTRMRRKIDLSPTAFIAQLPHPLPQPDTDIICHELSIALLSKQ